MPEGVVRRKGGDDDLACPTMQAYRPVKTAPMTIAAKASGLWAEFHPRRPTAAAIDTASAVRTSPMNGLSRNTARMAGMIRGLWASRPVVRTFIMSFHLEVAAGRPGPLLIARASDSVSVRRDTFEGLVHHAIGDRHPCGMRPTPPATSCRRVGCSAPRACAGP
jgi:hypothetical protein